MSDAGPRLTRALARVGPPVAWMGVIAVLSSSLFGAERTGSWILPLLGRLLPGTSPAALEWLHFLIRKTGHIVEYGVLAVLWRRAVAPGRAGRHAAAWALLLAAGYGGLDEARQGLTPNRTPSAWDVALDTAGAAFALILWDARSLARRLCRAARWLALALAGASLVAAGIEWRLGVPAWDLVLAALGLAILAWGLSGVERAWPPPA